jgi:hypothetical protein
LRSEIESEIKRTRKFWKKWPWTGGLGKNVIFLIDGSMPPGGQKKKKKDVDYFVLINKNQIICDGITLINWWLVMNHIEMSYLMNNYNKLLDLIFSSIQN